MRGKVWAAVTQAVNGCHKTDDNKTDQPSVDEHAAVTEDGWSNDS